MHFKHPPFTAAKAVRALLADAIATTWDEYFDGNHSANAHNATKPDSRGAPGQGPKEKAVTTAAAAMRINGRRFSQSLLMAF